MSFLRFDYTDLWITPIFPLCDYGDFMDYTDFYVVVISTVVEKSLDNVLKSSKISPFHTAPVEMPELVELIL